MYALFRGDTADARDELGDLSYDAIGLIGGKLVGKVAVDVTFEVGKSAWRVTDGAVESIGSFASVGAAHTISKIGGWVFS
jgi:hypothetical protein